MSAKRPALKSGKGKAAANRPAAARKPAARKPAEHAKAAAHARKPVTQPKKAPAHHTPAAAAPAATLRRPKPAGEPIAAPAPAEPKVAKKPLSPPAPKPAPAPANESDDHDGAEPGSLLAGPRNVQPYIAKRGEQYMGKEQLEHFRQILSNWKKDLMEEVDRTVSHMKDEAANFPDPNDRATQEEEFSLELRTRDRERKLIRKIDEAIKRVDDGTYGYCLETGEEIGIKRLEARPVATLSIEAQERRERRERQYGDRDDRYR